MEAIIKCKALEFELLHGKSIKSKNQKSKKQSGSESHLKLLKRFGDFPGCPVAKTPCLQCKGHKFQPWSGNQIPTCSCCSVTKSCLTLCNPMNCSTLDSVIHIHMSTLLQILFPFGLFQNIEQCSLSLLFVCFLCSTVCVLIPSSLLYSTHE